MKNVLKKFGLGILFISFCFIGARSAFAAAPLLTGVVYNETAKTITLTYDQAVHFVTTKYDHITTAPSPAILNIFPATWNVSTSSWDYGPPGPSTVAVMAAAVAQNATITSASFDVTNTILTVTYSGTLKETAYTHYVVDSWVAESAPGLDDGGYDLVNAGNEPLADAGTAISGFAVMGNDTTAPYLTATIHNERADTKTITYIWSKPIQFCNDVTEPCTVSAVVAENMDIYDVTDNVWHENDKTANVSITTSTFDGAGTIQTITYTGDLVSGKDYVVDSWGYDIIDMAGNRFTGETGVSPVFTATAGTEGTGPALTAVSHSEVAKTITLTYNKPVHFETAHGNIVTAVSPDILNIFATTLNAGSGLYKDYELVDVAPNVTIKTTTFNSDSTVLTVQYSGHLVDGAHYVVDSWVVDTDPACPGGAQTPDYNDGGYNIKDVAGNTDVDGVSPIFVASIPHGSGGGSTGGGSRPTTPTPTPTPTTTTTTTTTELAGGCSAGNLFNTSTGAACVNNAVEPQGCSGGNLFNTSTGAVCTNNVVLQIPGCGNSATGFSTATGLSCAGNHVTTTTTATVTTTTTTTTTGNGYAFGNTLVKEGSKGGACLAWQTFLNAHGASLATDGACGKLTMVAARLWQTSQGLVADGLLGAMSRAKANTQ